MQIDPNAPSLVVLGPVTFLRFVDCGGRPRLVNIVNLTGCSPDNFKAEWTAIFTTGARQPMISPYPVEMFDSLGIPKQDGPHEASD